MQILPISNLTFGIRSHFVGKSAKVLVPSSILATVGDMYEKRRNEAPINEYIDDVKDSYDQLVLDDEDSFDNYYHIDLALANSKMFRDKELFNPLLDDEQNLPYSEYDSNDLPVVHHNRAMNNNFYGIGLCDTDMGDIELPEMVKRPLNATDDDEKIFLSLKDVELMSSHNVRSMIKAVTPNEFVARNLKKLMLALIHNIDNDGTAATRVTDSDVDEIMYIVNSKNEQISVISYKLVMDFLKQHVSNAKINKYLKAYKENYTNGSLGLMKYYDLENGCYNKKEILNDNRFDLLPFLKSKQKK